MQAPTNNPPILPDDTPRIMRCAVPAPLYTLLDYLLPGDVDENRQLKPGIRVRVPLGNRTLTGVLIETHHSPDVALNRIKRAESLLDDEPLIDPTQLALLRWTAHYYLHPPGETLVLGLALRERRGEPPAPCGEPGVALSERGRGLPAGALQRAPKQAALLAALQKAPLRLTDLNELNISRSIVRELMSKGLAERIDMPPSPDWRCRSPLVANSEQSAALNGVIAALGSFSCHLLEGVTGSGKTEVYLQAVAKVIARGQQALVLLPEIGLTPQMVQRFKARFDAPIALLHSGLSDGERDRHWSMARQGHAAVVLGTRSAVFAPLANPGLIIVDEEHDTAFSQQDGLRYSARDVAVKRAQLSDCPVILGSATPSLETMANARTGRYQHHKLTQRAAGATIPTKRILDIRGLDLDAGISAPLHAAIQSTLERDEQVLLFLNRRGFAPTLMCHDCGWAAQCDHCDARMTLHRHPATLRCHHCNGRRPLPHHCPECASRRLVSSGLGTEQAEASLHRHYPQVRTFRVDSDSMGGKHAMAELGQELETRGACIILGTQMLTKGHHFPKVTCVGVIDADSLLFNPDFRGEERLAQLLTQVGGRAGRAQQAGEVIIQTRHPDHPLIQRVLEEPWQMLADQLLGQREQLGLPPVGALAALRCDSRALDHGLQFLEQVKRGAGISAGEVNVIGPLPAAMARRAGLYRSQLVLQARDRRRLGEVAAKIASTAASTKAPSGLRWFMDIDPIDTL